MRAKRSREMYCPYKFGYKRKFFNIEENLAATMVCFKPDVFIFSLLIACLMLSSAKANAAADTNTVIRLNAQALELAYSEPDSALSVAKKSLELARALGYASGEIRALIRMGIVYDVQSKDSLAIAAYEQSLVLAKRASDMSAIASDYNNLGLIYWKQNLLDKALDNFNNAYDVFRKLKRNEQMAAACNNTGLIHYELKRFDASLQWFRKALMHYEAIKPDEKQNPTFDCEIYDNMANVLNDLNKNDSAEYYIVKAIAGFRAYNNLYDLSKTLSNYGVLLNQTGRESEAPVYFEEAISIAKKLDNRFSYVSSGYNLSYSYCQTKQYEKGLKVLEEIYPLLSEIKNNELAFKIVRSMAKNYFRQNNYPEGEKYLYKHDEYYEAYYKELLNKNIAEVEKKFELQEEKRKAFEAENEKLKAQLEVKEKNYWLIGLLLVITVGIFAVVVFLQKSKVRQEREKIKAIVQERDKGLKAIIDAQEGERVRIAKELHEGVGNQLLALHLNIRNNTGKPQSDKVAADINKLLTETMDEVRNVSHRMMPKVLQEFGCVSALSDMLEKSLQHSGIKCHFETHQVSGKRYEPRLEITIFRVAQELVNNIIKHSQADTVNVQFMELKHALVLLVEDNGKGMDTSIPTDGIGIASIKSRVNALGGELNIVSEKGKGTVVTVRILLV